MNVTGIRPREEIYSYNSIKLNILRGQQILAAKKRVNAEVIRLDIAKAVSDMGKDTALQQYQYFVGGGDTTPSTSAFRTGENFAL